MTTRRMLPHLHKNPYYESFIKNPNDSELLDGLDDEEDTEDNDAHDLEKEMWLGTLQDCDVGEYNSIITFLDCLKLLS